MRDELDKDLQSLFEEKSRGLPEEPFLGNMLRLIEKRRRRRSFVRWLAYGLGLACCAFFSPFLIKGSVVLSAGLSVVFAAVSGFVSSSVGMSFAILALIFVFFRRRHVPGPNATANRTGF